ncbi:thioredoxin domain-containing protein [Salsipaludibacter albus]|uniref:thioredoxin domain-containing protein n=1 Tax=Salsipaludibacter albus TaxID=2849650 RepID=UPI001EE454CE|nr:thioredoxin domain-containing protein [Salsipaludibacter albus]
MVNRLAEANSPYLLQHADNPVDWWEWGDDAFAEARERDVPVFLSVGYSSCHWCHVMAHESFEDEDTARFLDDHFVSIKVDREERPDIDAVYMTATQALTGQGGWPMSVWLDHEARPFYAGTYFPATSHHGMPSFRQVLVALRDAWADRRDELQESAASITSSLRAATERSAGGGDAAGDAIDLDDLCEQATRLVVERAWDRDHGGFGRAPKFPQAMLVQFLLDQHVVTGDAEALAAATSALEAMARGGIHDHVVGGFARYSTDARWLLPHFEKMLYDNGLLLEAYADAAVLTGRADLAAAADGIATWLVDEMQEPGGAFAAALDADTQGEEGATTVWTDTEFREVVAEAGADPDLLADFWGVRPEGNFRPERGEPAGDNILHTTQGIEAFASAHDLDPTDLADTVEQARVALRERRATRPQPGRDDKVLVAWNALAIRGLARAGAVLDRLAWVDAAVQAADFLLDALVDDEGRLLHVHRRGRSSVPAFLDDVAGLAVALLELGPVAGRPDLVARAADLVDDATTRFATDDGGFATTSADAETLVVRPRDVHDGAQPAGTSLLAAAQARLGLLTGEHGRTTMAADLVARHATSMAQNPTAHGELLRVARFLAADPREVAIVGPAGDARAALAGVALGRPRPGTVVVVADPSDDEPPAVPLLEGRTAVDGHAAAYVCRGFVCDRPVTTTESLVDALDRGPDGR